MNYVYLITFYSGSEKVRKALEISNFADVVPALLALGAEDATKVEVFRAQLLHD